MVGAIRLYIEPNDRLPESMRPADRVPVIDCAPHEARDLKRRLVRQGYSVILQPL